MIAAQSGPKPVFVAPAPDDSPFQERIEIHDIRNRYLLTKEPTQDKVRPYLLQWDQGERKGEGVNCFGG